jgi:hypothetical protein
MTRSAHASSNATPLIEVRRSTRKGGKPSWATRFGCEKSSRRIPSADNGAPNFASASTTRPALVSEASTHKSRSAVARGTPCTASACAPTTMNRTLAATNSRRMSRKSSINARDDWPAQRAGDAALACRCVDMTAAADRQRPRQRERGCEALPDALAATTRASHRQPQRFEAKRLYRSYCFAASEEYSARSPVELHFRAA